jgi:predicted nucleic acid-binding Zn ribbon protein
MWLTRSDKRLSDENTKITYSYECKNCGYAKEKSAME